MKLTKSILLFSALLTLVFSCKNEEKPVVKVETEKVTEVKNEVNRIEPPHWWIGFKDKSLQLLVNHPNISEATPSISYEGVSIKKVNKADSPNYLFIDLEISEIAKAGQFNIHFKFEDGTKLVQTYQLKDRDKAADQFVGFDNSDAIYLITPDRFSNGNPNNDSVEGLQEQSVDRSHDYKRHGGDITGITNHLDYINDMGFTQVWSCPLLTNDMKNGSYHGYAITDYYQVDPRFGTMEEYINLSQKAREKGMGMIMDQVANHCGVSHWWMKDLPFKDWVNQQSKFENGEPLNNSNHRRTVNQDLYASKQDKKEMNEGWFVPSMPDLNQRNPFMAKYITQNSIWWIETLKLSGIRQDTYPYPDKDFMSSWAKQIMTEYPNFSIVGEEWSYNPLLIGYWQAGHKNKDGYNGHLKSTMDFAMNQNIVDALNQDEAWDRGLIKMYEGLANDFSYTSPKDIMIFLDNHDKSRVFTQFNGDITKTKTALSYMLTLPRIPQIYYGTEILMDDFEKPGDHGLIRTDFPGGWQDDAVNAFTGKGLTEEQLDMQRYIKTLLNYRKESNAIHNGKTIHFAPFNGTYFLFRIAEDETVVHIINKNENPIIIDLNRYDEVGLKGKTLTNIISGETMIWEDVIQLDEKGSLILTTKK
ncbi:glycoside hydrolase family 13 protein [Mesoflavibacter sp. SCSIO 43206]|uniref:glycoside hydrolase family 13 protein n=1 Tax=Mesoflavibacter sp. SCSIO 43206 TaxID=2779362 RepID=UPI001CA83483|nr:glycoside hydrolase family 13 protein [Mesoflavibacter sp. SCSIO 43206]UAB76102.1 glycoside hydrolase family 13 protein [Mesoflavibacter sp. SCSIO 43206]